MYRFYSLLRPVSLGTFPTPAGVDYEIKNYNNKVFVDEIDRYAWGHVDYSKDIRKYGYIPEEYDMVPSSSNYYREARPGDVVRIGKSGVVIAEILSQSHSSDWGWIDIEFKDIRDNYRHWRNFCDGGRLSYFEEYNRYESASDVVKSSLQYCLRVLRSLNVAGGNVFLVSSGDVYWMYVNGTNMGSVSRTERTKTEEDKAFQTMLGYLEENFRFRMGMILFPSSFTNGEFVLLKDNKFAKRYFEWLYKKDIC